MSGARCRGLKALGVCLSQASGSADQVVQVWGSCSSSSYGEATIAGVAASGSLIGDEVLQPDTVAVATES